MCVLIKNDWNAQWNVPERAEFLCAARNKNLKRDAMYVSNGNEERKEPIDRTTLLCGVSHNFCVQ